MKFKKGTLVICMILVAIFMSAAGAQAGIMSTVVTTTTDWLLEHAIGTIMTMLFMLVGAFAGGTSWGKAALKAKAPISELDDVVVKLYQARKENSPGGKTITSEEWNGILGEAQDVVEKTIEAFGVMPATKV